MLEIEAKKRQVESKIGNQNASKTTNQKIDELKSDAKHPQALSQAAAQFGTNRQYVADAKKLKTDDPELFEKVKNGSVSVYTGRDNVTTKDRSNPAFFVVDCALLWLFIIQWRSVIY